MHIVRVRERKREKEEKKKEMRWERDGKVLLVKVNQEDKGDSVLMGILIDHWCCIR